MFPECVTPPQNHSCVLYALYPEEKPKSPNLVMEMKEIKFRNGSYNMYFSILPKGFWKRKETNTLILEKKILGPNYSTQAIK